MLLENARDQGRTADVSVTECTCKCRLKKKQQQQLRFLVPQAWTELWLITLFHIQGCALKIAAPPPLGGSQGTKGEQAAKEQRRWRAPCVLISLSNAVAAQVTSHESTAGSERCRESAADPTDEPPGVGLMLMFPDSECSRLCSRSVSPSSWSCLVSHTQTGRRRRGGPGAETRSK